MAGRVVLEGTPIPTGGGASEYHELVSEAKRRFCEAIKAKGHDCMDAGVRATHGAVAEEPFANDTS